MRAPPRSFSQLATSFFAGLRQGIPRALLHRLAIPLPFTERWPHLSAQGARPSLLSAHSDRTRTVKQHANRIRVIVCKSRCRWIGWCDDELFSVDALESADVLAAPERR